ncbi:MAG: DHHW family protein [Clostridia bacterium]|nr:DHHW family protein [Clostridia bacterium]
MKSKLISAVFIVFVFAVAILYAFTPKTNFSETEKRYLAEFPKFSFESLSSGKFTSDFEEYLSDHAPFRNVLVSLNSYFELAKGNNGSNGIYLGSDGWLIEKPFDRENRFDTNVRRITAFARSTGIPTAITAVPEKGFIYGENLPKNALKYNDDQCFKKLTSQCKDSVKFINLSDALNAQKNDKQIFYKTDHHWTCDGAFIGYNEICKALNLTAAEENSFNIQTADNFYGTSYSTSLYTLTKPDTMKIMRSQKTNGAAEVVIEDGNTEKSENMFFDDNLKGSDKYTVFLDGNHPFVRIKTGNEGGKLLVIKDSFAHCLVPFLAENYSEIVMIDLRYYKKPVSQLLSAESFNQILFVYGMENLAESRDIILK